MNRHFMLARGRSPARAINVNPRTIHWCLVSTGSTLVVVVTVTLYLIVTGLILQMMEPASERVRMDRIEAFDARPQLLAHHQPQDRLTVPVTPGTDHDEST